jgi:hypothetical protein
LDIESYWPRGTPKETKLKNGGKKVVENLAAHSARKQRIYRNSKKICWTDKQLQVKQEQILWALEEGSYARTVTIYYPKCLAFNIKKISQRNRKICHMHRIKKQSMEYVAKVT